MKVYKVHTENFVIGYYSSLKLAENARDEHHQKELNFYLEQFSNRKKSIEETILPAFALRNEIEFIGTVHPRYVDIEELKDLKKENTILELATIDEIEVME